MFRGFNISVRGASHITRDAECQDYSGYACGGNYCAAAVSDGHGGERHFRSGAGAKAAVNIGLEAVKELIANEEDFLPSMERRYQTVLKQFAGYISAKWVDDVVAHFNENPITQSERELYEKYYLSDNAGAEQNITAMYGATLIIGVITRSYAFVVQIGDGACVVELEDGNCVIPPPTLDERLFLGYTTSLCDANVLGNFRFYYSHDKLKAIVLSTDGVVDSYGKNNFLKFNKTLCDLFIENHDEAYYNLSDWLPRLSARGSKDDMSVACVYRVE
ncbi:MAG: protein phosphatase 2C domain-containing protein [Clostridiales bacterium]|jgi:serine/threonine protein phosphatase PrpC|nr:protein phosphatase 2C domain-containing protein [Clostridiales bacterium]